MSDDHDSSSKTEEPTARRLEDARKRGEVAKSVDLASWAALAGTAGTIAVAGGWMTRDLAGRLLPFIESPDAFTLQNGGAVNVMKLALMAAAPALAVILGAGMVSGVAGNLIQHGFLWAPERMQPSFDKVSPMAGFKRLFGLDGLVQFLKSVLKVAVLTVVAFLVMKPHAAETEGLAALDPAAILPLSAALLRSLALAVVLVLGVGAGADWIWQRQRFMTRMRMSREEVKEDVRQSEGDPHVRARLRQLRMQRSRQRMVQAVPKATLVVVNPTHYAVALRYEQGETAAPVCVAKGVDRLALKIREVAEANDVPVIEDPPLARALFASVEVDEAIPVSHYEAVAKIVGFVLAGAKKRAAVHG